MSFDFLWKNYISSGFGDKGYSEMVSKISFINIFSLVGISSLFGLGYLNYISGNTHVGVVEIIIGLIATANVLLLRVHKNYNFASLIIIIAMFFTLSFLLNTGGYGRTGIYWTYTFPVLVFFLRGKREGLLWIVLFFLAVFLLKLADSRGLISMSYSYVELKQLLLSLLAISVLIYFYQHVQEGNLKLLREKDNILEEYNRKMQDEVKADDIVKNRLETVVKESIDIKKAVLNILEDVQDEKNKVEQISQRFALATKSAQIGVWSWDLTTDTLEADEQFYKLYHASPEDFTSALDGFMSFVHPNDIAGAKKYIEGVVKGKEKQMDTHFKIIWRADGSVHYLRTVADVLRDEKGKAYKIVGVQWDETKEKEIDQAKSEFVSLASHQLRTPLSAINWYSEMLLAGDAGKLNDEQKKYVQEVYFGNQRMVDLVNSLLNVSRLELGTFLVEPAPTNVVELAQSVIDEQMPQVKAKNLKFTSSLSKDIPIIPADSKLLRMVIQNLLSNAIKYTPDKGKVSLALSLDAKKKNLLFTVADTGYGIPENQKSRIFSKLFRADNVREMDTEGTGLGLYIVKSIIDQSGGRVWFESEKNKGTTFYVELPLTGMRKKEGTKSLS